MLRPLFRFLHHCVSVAFDLHSSTLLLESRSWERQTEIWGSRRDDKSWVCQEDDRGKALNTGLGDRECAFPDSSCGLSMGRMEEWGSSLNDGRIGQSSVLESGTRVGCSYMLISGQHSQLLLRPRGCDQEVGQKTQAQEGQCLAKQGWGAVKL